MNNTGGLKNTGMEYQKEAPKNDKQEEKPDMSLLPLDLLEYETRPYQYGCEKYYRNSWRLGFKQSRMIAAALRHISDYWDKGEMFDTEALETTGIEVHHVTMAIFNLRCVMDSIINHPQFDDRYKKNNDDTWTEEQIYSAKAEGKRLAELFKQEPKTDMIECQNESCPKYSTNYANHCGAQVNVNTCAYSDSMDIPPEQINTEQIQCRSLSCAHHTFSYDNNCGSDVDIRECRNATF